MKCITGHTAQEEVKHTHTHTQKQKEVRGHTGRSGLYLMVGNHFGEKTMVVKIKMQKWIEL